MYNPVSLLMFVWIIAILKFHSSAIFMVSTTCIMMLVCSYELFMENKQMGMCRTLKIVITGISMFYLMNLYLVQSTHLPYQKLKFNSMSKKWLSGWSLSNQLQWWEHVCLTLYKGSTTIGPEWTTTHQHTMQDRWYVDMKHSVTGYGVAGQQPNYGYWVWKSGCLV